MSNMPATWKLSELLTRAGLEERAFRTMRSAGAVDPPSGVNRGARYGGEHLAQIQRVLFIEQSRGLSRSAACEWVRDERKATRRSPAIQSRNRAAAELSFKGTVRRLTPRVYLVYQKQLSGLERLLIHEATLRFRKANQEIAASAPASHAVRSTTYRANWKRRPGRA